MPVYQETNQVIFIKGMAVYRLIIIWFTDVHFKSQGIEDDSFEIVIHKNVLVIVIDMIMRNKIESKDLTSFMVDFHSKGKDMKIIYED